jgi:epoxyqueuosine reductase
VPYYIHKGGIFLKDSAVCAGLGVIGKNNLLITPEYGPRVRLRALFVNVQLDSTYIHNDFKPCENCECPAEKLVPRKLLKATLMTGHYAKNKWKRMK